MSRRKTHRKIQIQELRDEVKRRVGELCDQSRNDCVIYKRSVYGDKFAMRSGVVIRLKPTVRSQPWEYVNQSELQQWKNWLDADAVRPDSPIPPLELLAREMK